MKQARDLFSEHAREYARFRPFYPESLFEYLLTIVSGRQFAWDAGTGNGQAAVRLARDFVRVAGTDISRRQIQQAPHRSNIEWLVCRAEESPFPSGSADLITVGQALHWFSIPDFKQEVNRVLKKDGVLACFGYELLNGPAPLDRVIDKLYNGILDGYWPEERIWIENRYEGIGIDFTESKEFFITFRWGYRELKGYLSTWSAVKAYQKANGKDPLELISAELHAVMSSPAEITFPIFLKTWTPSGNM